MRKLIIVLAGVLLLAVFIMPYVTGRVAEKMTQQFTTQLNDKSAQYGQLDIQQYDRGFGSTDFSFSWMPDGNFKGLAEQPISYACIADHGVLSLSYECEAENLPEYTKFVAEKLNGKDPIAIVGEVSVFGNITQQVRLDAFEFVSDEGQEISIASGLLSVQTDQALNTFDLNGSFDGLEVSGTDDGEESFAIKDVDVNGNFSTNQHQILIGDFDLSIDHLSGADKGNSDGEINGLEIRGETLEQGENLEVKYRFSADEFLSEQMVENDETEVEDIQFGFALSGINMAHLKVLLDQLQELIGQSGSDSNALKLTLLPKLEALLKNGLSMKVDMSAEYESEDIGTEFSLALVDDLRLGDFVLMAVSPQAVLSKAEAHYKSTIPEALAGDSAVAKSPLYVQTKSGYQSNFQLEDGQITLNGKNLTIEELMSLGDQ